MRRTFLYIGGRRSVSRSSSAASPYRSLWQPPLEYRKDLIVSSYDQWRSWIDGGVEALRLPPGNKAWHCACTIEIHAVQCSLALFLVDRCPEPAAGEGDGIKWKQSTHLRFVCSHLCTRFVCSHLCTSRTADQSQCMYRVESCRPDYCVVRCCDVAS